MLLNEKPLVSSLCRSSKATNQCLKWMLCAWLHLEEENAERDDEVESKDLDSINGVYRRVHGTFLLGP